jgi:hypothetical protein
VSQIQNTVTRPEALSQPLTDHRSMVGALVAVALIAGFIGTAFALRPGAEQALADPVTAVTDGWLHGSLGVVSAGTAHASDGWASRYLVSGSSGQVTDGWASRYLVSGGSGQVTDGWASRYLPTSRDD